MSTRRRSVKDFQFGSKIGEGSYSTVFKAVDVYSRKVYAIKILSKSHIVKEKKIKYVNIEKQTLNRLGHHPGIVTLYYTFQDESSLFFVIDFAEYGELLTLIRKLGLLNEVATRYYMVQLVDAVKFMHSKGVIHRDLKPENILLNHDMKLMITDFGAAKMLDENGSEEIIKSELTGGSENSTGTKEKAASFVGTAEYVLPELLQHNECGYESDIWAVGCILYQFVVGAPPFKGATEYLTFEKIIALDYKFPSYFLPENIKHLITNILVLDPKKRYSIVDIQQHAFFKGVPWSDFSFIWKRNPPKIEAYDPRIYTQEQPKLKPPYYKKPIVNPSKTLDIINSTYVPSSNHIMPGSLPKKGFPQQQKFPKFNRPPPPPTPAAIAKKAPATPASYNSSPSTSTPPQSFGLPKMHERQSSGLRQPPNPFYRPHPSYSTGSQPASPIRGSEDDSDSTQDALLAANEALRTAQQFKAKNLFSNSISNSSLAAAQNAPNAPNASNDTLTHPYAVRAAPRIHYEGTAASPGSNSFSHFEKHYDVPSSTSLFSFRSNSHLLDAESSEKPEPEKATPKMAKSLTLDTSLGTNSRVLEPQFSNGNPFLNINEPANPRVEEMKLKKAQLVLASASPIIYSDADVVPNAGEDIPPEIMKALLPDEQIIKLDTVVLSLLLFEQILKLNPELLTNSSHGQKLRLTDDTINEIITKHSRFIDYHARPEVMLVTTFGRLLILQLIDFSNRLYEIKLTDNKILLYDYEFDEDNPGGLGYLLVELSDRKTLLFLSPHDHKKVTIDFEVNVGITWIECLFKAKQLLKPKGRKKLNPEVEPSLKYSPHINGKYVLPAGAATAAAAAALKADHR